MTRRRRLVVAGVTGVAALFALTIGSTGAYFTGVSTSAVQTGSSAALPQPASLTVTKTGTTSGQSTSVDWTQPATRPWEASGLSSASVQYSVKRNTVNDFADNAGATEVYRGTGLSAVDTVTGPAVSLNGASQVYAFQRMDASIAVVNGKTYRWGLAFRQDDRNAVWAGASGQIAFNSGVLTEMQFASTAEEVISVAPGRDHACALSVTHKIYCAGFSDFGQAANGASATATTAGGLVQWTLINDANAVFTGKTVAQLVSGEYFSCALATDGTIGCWGLNSSRQLGSGATTGSSLAVPVKVEQTNGTNWAAFASNKPTMIAAGANHVCAVKGAADGVAPTNAVACWGAVESSQLGTYTTGATAEPRDIADPNGVLTGITSISAGTGATCVTNNRATANIACWGAGALRGSLTAASTTAPANSGTPAAIQTSLGGFTTIDLGYTHACATNGSLPVCWGIASFTKLGVADSDTNSFYPPRPIVDTDNIFGGETVVSVGAGWSHTCAGTASGSVACWGYGAQYQLGQGSSATDGSGNATTAKPVNVLFDGAKLRPVRADLLAESSGGQSYVVARISGQYYQWGRNVSGTVTAPVVFTGLPANVVKIASGVTHMCALTASSAIYCAGSNNAGQLGDGTTTGHTNAAVITDTGGVFTGKTIIDITAYNNGACALASDGTIGCWGNAALGQMAEYADSSSPVPIKIGTGTNRNTPYTALSGTSQPRSLAGGANHVCARTDVSVVCWGLNSSSQLGRSSNNRVPAAVSGSNLSAGVVSIDVGGDSSCAVKSNGTAFCWGSTYYGQLGNGASTTAVATPTAVPGTGWQTITVGTAHSCGTKTGVAEPLCWGANSAGQSAQATSTTTVSTPTAIRDPLAIFSGTSVAGIFLGSDETCSMTASGTIACWGSGYNGVLAQNGATTDKSTPVIGLIASGKPMGPTLACIGGAVLVGQSCSLVPTRTYYYEVTYRLSGADNWVSAPRTATR